MKKVFRLMLAVTMVNSGVMLAGPAWAGCVPACTGGDICRYEAAGGTFKCKAPPQGAGDKELGSRRGAGAKQPAVVAPGNPQPKQVQQK